MDVEEWKALAWDAYVREPDYRLAAEMTLALRGPNTLEEYRTIAFVGLKSRIINGNLRLLALTGPPE